MRPSRYVTCSKCGKSVRTRGWAAHWGRSHPGLVVPGIPPVGASLEARPSRWTWADLGRPESGPVVHGCQPDPNCKACQLQARQRAEEEKYATGRRVALVRENVNLEWELKKLKTVPPVVQHHGQDPTCPTCVTAGQQLSSAAHAQGRADGYSLGWAQGQSDLVQWYDKYLVQVGGESLRDKVKAVLAKGEREWHLYHDPIRIIDDRPTLRDVLSG